MAQALQDFVHLLENIIAILRVQILGRHHRYMPLDEETGAMPDQDHTIVYSTTHPSMPDGEAQTASGSKKTKNSTSGPLVSLNICRNLRGPQKPQVKNHRMYHDGDYSFPRGMVKAFRTRKTRDNTYHHGTHFEDRARRRCFRSCQRAIARDNRTVKVPVMDDVPAQDFRGWDYL